MPLSLPFAPAIRDRRASATSCAATSVHCQTVTVDLSPSDSTSVKTEAKKRVSISDSVVEVTIDSPPSHVDRQLTRLQSIQHAHLQWQLSIDKYSKMRKRQNQPISDAETAVDQFQHQLHHSQLPLTPVTDAAADQEVKQTTADLPGFSEHKPSLWKKRVRSVILRLKGQEQHKDVYVMPQHLRAQLKQMYVY